MGVPNIMGMKVEILLQLMPASADAGSGASFAVFCKRRDAFGGQLDAMVRLFALTMINHFFR
jgi:hypothetical protein